MEPGCLVEFIDNQKIICAVVVEIKNLRLRLLTEHNREVKLTAGRLSHKSDLRLDISLSRDKLVRQLKEMAARRRLLSEQVDIQELWEILNSEQEWIDLPTMTAFCFTDHPGNDEESAVIRAFFNDRLYFRFAPDRFFPNSSEKVDQILAQRNAAELEKRLIDQGAQWLQKCLKGQDLVVPENGAEIIEILTTYYLLEKESSQRDLARAMLKNAGITSHSAIFTFLVRIGVWHANQNLDLLRFNINPEMPETVRRGAIELCSHPPAVETTRRDLRSLPVLTIDGPSTLDFDDALSISSQDDHYLLGIHIADVAHYVTRGDEIDQEAMARGSSIYMPDQKISMLPGTLSEDLCSLKAGQDRPAISVMIRVTPKAEILGFEFVPSLIRVHRQLSYQDVDAIADRDETIAALYTIAQNYRRRRLDNGALFIQLPEIVVWLNPAGEPLVSRIDRENPGRMLVAELMILANELTARFLTDHNLPAVFRSQPEPRERLFVRDQGSLYQNWMQRKQISRFILASRPEAHSGLGLPAYVTATSPIRKYFDLVTQRQLRAALGIQTAYEPKEIDFIIASLEEPMAQVARIQFRRQRYWLLKYLESRIGKKQEALVLNKRRDGYAILLLDFMFECHLSGAENIKLRPEDLVQVTLQHVNARHDVITVLLG